MEAGLYDSIVVPLIREQSIKAATLSTESTAGSSSPKNGQSTSTAIMFHRCAFEVNASFAQREPIVTRILPTKYKHIMTAKDIQSKIIKERFEAKIRAIKRPQNRCLNRGVSQCDRILRHTMYQNNMLYKESTHSVVVPMMLTEKMLTRK